MIYKIGGKETILIKRLINILFIIGFLSTELCYASFLDIGMGPRALGMGNAFVGLADDITGCYYNPAGLAQLNEQEIGFYYTPLLWANMGDAFLGYAIPLSEDIGTFGVTWINRNVLPSGLRLYAEDSYIFTYSRKIINNLYCGVNFKVLQLEYPIGRDLADPIFKNGTTSFGMGFDLGFLYHISNGLSVGFCMKDINQPDLALVSDGSNPTPMSIKVGADYKIGDIHFLGDFSFRNNIYKIGTGMEWCFLNTLSIRGGFGFGNMGFMQLSAGGSYVLSLGTLAACELDYAFLFPLNGLWSGGTHLFGMNIKFGEEKIEIVKTPLDKDAEGSSLQSNLESNASEKYEISSNNKNLLQQNIHGQHNLNSFHQGLPSSSNNLTVNSENRSSLFSVSPLNVQISPFQNLTIAPSPPIFSPNGDGINDQVTFTFSNPDNSEVVLAILDLSGVIMRFESLGIGSTIWIWDGKDNMANVAEAGVYIYQIRIGSSKYTGTIVLAK